MGRRYIKTAVKGGDQTGLLGLLYTGGIGSTLGEQIFASGLKTVQSLALASLKAWDAIVSASVSIIFLSNWDSKANFFYPRISGTFSPETSTLRATMVCS